MGLNDVHACRRLHIVKQTPVVINTTLYYFIGIGAGPAGPVFAGSLFWRFNETSLLKSSVRTYYNRTASEVLPKPPVFCQRMVTVTGRETIIDTGLGQLCMCLDLVVV